MDLLLAAEAPNKTTTEKILERLAGVLKLLPTGTVFVFEFLNPVVTNNGKCHHSSNKILAAILLAFCGLSCAFASFTDSYTDKKGKTHYGIVTLRGLWTFQRSSGDDDDDGRVEEVQAKYRLQWSDFAHALLAVLAFAVLTVLDLNTVRCFYPSLAKEENTLIAVLPAVMGVVSSGVFAVFPNSRHGIGYRAANSRIFNSTA